MTELQLGLIALGALVIASVLGYNHWQARQHRKMAERMLRAEHSDVLFNGAKARHADPVPPEERREPGMSSLSPPDHDDEPVFTEDLPATLLDPRLEFIVAMELVESVTGERIWDLQGENFARLNKPVHVIGFDESARNWEKTGPDASTPYRRLRIGLQLADRRGPLSEADLTVFSASMRQLADALLAVADMPAATPMLDQAMTLDRFAAEVDLEIGINLVSQSLPFHGSKIRALAEAAGMVLDDGLFVRHDSDGFPLFCLQNFESTLLAPESINSMSTHGLTFLLDVPRVTEGEQAFDQMAGLAKRFAEALSGALVDDNRQPLSDTQLERIRQDFVNKPQAAMARYGIPAGSPQALRLFSCET